MTNGERPGGVGPRRPARSAPSARVVRRVPPPSRSRRLRALWGWVAGVAAAVAATVLTTWLVAWGLVPDGRPSSSPPPATTPPAGSPTPGDQPPAGEEPFTVAVRAGQQSWLGWISDRPFASVPARPAYQADWEPWVNRVGAVPAGSAVRPDARHRVRVRIRGSMHAQCSSSS